MVDGAIGQPRFGTAKMNGLEPQAYVADAITRIGISNALNANRCRSLACSRTSSAVRCIPSLDHDATGSAMAAAIGTSSARWEMPIFW